MGRKSLQAIAGAVALTAPWTVVWVLTRGIPRVSGYEPAGALSLSTTTVVALTGISILGAAFLLAWGAETAEKDVPTAFAVAVLAVIAVAPEYAVDALFAWESGALQGTPRGAEAGNLAIANMTGANRILIGIGWAGVALFTIFQNGSSEDPAVSKEGGVLSNAVEIDREIVLEISFLFIATLWAFLIPLNGGIDIIDTVFLVGLYVAYIAIVLQGDVEPDEEHVGVPAYLQTLPKPRRVATVILLFVYSGGVIFTAVEPFAHGLEVIGEGIGIPPFFMIQWVAPLASEAPELIVVLYLVNKARSTAGFNTLISSKLNQWTLLIGTLAIAYSVGLGEYGALSFDAKQTAEIWLTAAQSFFAIAILVDFEITVREAIALLALFLSQVVIEFVIVRGLVGLPLSSQGFLLVFTAVYLVLGTVLFALRRDEVASLTRDTVETVSTVFGSGEGSS